MSVTKQQVEDAIDKLHRLEIINSPDLWKQNYMNWKWLDELLVRCGEKLTRYGTRTATPQEGVAALAASGLINTPDYWSKQTGTVTELLKALGGAALATFPKKWTEETLRRHVADTIKAWLGVKQGGKTHKAIIDLYNSQRPLPAGYKVSYADYWCAATASATYMKAGIAEFTGTECSCGRWIEIARKKGIWVENDAYVPKVGDAVIYDWKDDKANYAKKDDVTGHDHIGIVTAVSGRSFTVVEGNLSKAVGTRSMAVNGWGIRGFIAPDYAAAVKKLNAV